MFTVSKLRHVARVYKRPQAIFYLKKVPRKLAFPDFRVRDPRKQGRLEPEAKLAIRRIREFKQAAVELSRLLGQEPSADFVGLFKLGDNYETAARKKRVC
ncbi:MAG: hypothetical protein ACTSU5_04195 [Promethearchaeota archaeon]